MNALSPQSAESLLGSTSVSTADADAELVAACARFCELERAWVAAGSGNIEFGTAEEAACEAERERIDELKDPLIDRILDLPCTTLPGLRAVAGALADWDLELLKDGPGDVGKLLTFKLVSGLLAVPSASDPDAELIALCAEFRASEAAYCRIYDDADLDDTTATEDARDRVALPILKSWAGILDRMATLRAVTQEGVAARAFALAQHSGIKPGTDHYAFAFDPDGDKVSDRLLHYLLRDALAVMHGVPANPDAELLALRSEYERLRAECDAENSRDGEWTDEIQAAIGKPFDDVCRKIIDLPPAVTRAGRALKAIAAMHELACSGAHFADSDPGLRVCWNMLKQEVGEKYPLPGAPS